MAVEDTSRSKRMKCGAGLHELRTPPERDPGLVSDLAPRGSEPDVVGCAPLEVIERNARTQATTRGGFCLDMSRIPAALEVDSQPLDGPVVDEVPTL